MSVKGRSRREFKQMLSYSDHLPSDDRRESSVTSGYVEECSEVLRPWWCRRDLDAEADEIHSETSQDERSVLVFGRSVRIDDTVDMHTYDLRRSLSE